jgi:hypothetical protein
MTDSTPAVSEALRRLKMLARPGDMPDLLAVQAGMDDLTRQLAEAQAELARRTSEVIDGGTLQNAAVKHGLLAEHEVAEPCGDGCNCASYGDFPQTCYRPTDTMKRDAAMGGGTGEG